MKLPGALGVGIAKGVDDRPDELAIMEAKARFPRPGGPARRADEGAAVEPRVFGIAAVGDQTGAAIVGEFATAEPQCADALAALGLDIDPRAGRAGDARLADVVKAAILERIIAPADDAAALPPVMVARDIGESAGGIAAIEPVDDDPVERMMMAVDPAESLRPAVVHQLDAASGNLPAAVAELSANLQSRRIAVELNIGNLNCPAAILDPDHRPIGGGPFAEAKVGHAALNGPVGRPIEGAEEHSRGASKAGAIATDDQRQAAANELHDRDRRERICRVASGTPHLLADQVSGPAKHDLAPSPRIDERGHGGEGIAVVGAPVAPRPELLGGDRAAALDGDGRIRQHGDGAGAEQQITSSGGHPLSAYNLGPCSAKVAKAGIRALESAARPCTERRRYYRETLC